MNISEIKARIASLLECSISDIVLNKVEANTQTPSIRLTKDERFLITYSSNADLVHEFFHACFTPNNETLKTYSGKLLNALEDLRIDAVARKYDPELANVVTDEMKESMDFIVKNTNDPTLAALKALCLPYSLDNTRLLDKAKSHDESLVSTAFLKHKIQVAREDIVNDPTIQTVLDVYGDLQDYFPDSTNPPQEKEGEEGRPEKAETVKVPYEASNYATEKQREKEEKSLKEKALQVKEEAQQHRMGIELPTIQQQTRIIKGIRDLMQNKAIGKRENTIKGKLNTKRLGRRPSDYVFTLKHNPSPETKLYTLIDLSGSMHGNKLSTVIQFANTLRKIDDKNLKLELRAFNSMYFANDQIGTDVNSCSSYNMRITDPNSKESAAAYNDDAYFVRKIREEIQNDRSPNKVLLILSDGGVAPSGNFEYNNLEVEARELDKSGIPYVSIGILDSSVKDYYKNHVIVKDIEALSDIMARQIRKLINLT